MAQALGHLRFGRVGVHDITSCEEGAEQELQGGKNDSPSRSMEPNKISDSILARCQLVPLPLSLCSTGRRWRFYDFTEVEGNGEETKLGRDMKIFVYGSCGKVVEHTVEPVKSPFKPINPSLNQFPI